MNNPNKLKSIVVAIDGYSSCGKSTLAKQIAEKLNFLFIDSGAMYRAVTLYFLKNNINIQNTEDVTKALTQIHIRFENIDGKNITFLNGENVENEIRSLAVSNLVSEVAAITCVRKKMVALQRGMSGENGIVMDGRDIGSVVFPDADIKIFVTADPIVRAQRRYNELVAKNQHVDLHEIISNLAHRDKIDTERADSPLMRAENSILLDNTEMSISEQFDLVLDLVTKKISEKSLI